jgi:hypothetical protein
MSYEPQSTGYLTSESKDGVMTVSVSYPGTFSKITLELTPRMTDRLRRHVSMGKGPERSALFQNLATTLHLLLASLDGHDLHPLSTVVKKLQQALVEFEEYTNKIKERSPIPVSALPPIIKL